MKFLSFFKAKQNPLHFKRFRFAVRNIQYLETNIHPYLGSEFAMVLATVQSFKHSLFLIMKPFFTLQSWEVQNRKITCTFQTQSNLHCLKRTINGIYIIAYITHIGKQLFTLIVNYQLLLKYNLVKKLQVLFKCWGLLFLIFDFAFYRILVLLIYESHFT